MRKISARTSADTTAVKQIADAAKGISISALMKTDVVMYSICVYPWQKLSCVSPVSSVVCFYFPRLL